MSATCIIGRKFIGTETPTNQATDLAPTQTFSHQIGPTSDLRLTSESDAPVSVIVSDDRTLALGTDTIDLTAAPGYFGATKNLTGKRLQAFEIIAHEDNSDAIVVAPDGVNGYNLLGHASALVYLFAKMRHRTTCEGVEALPEVGPTAKLITITSDMAAAKYKIVMAFG